jgi:hypothetical protein
MKPIEGWRSVLARSWSIRLASLAALFSALAAATSPNGELHSVFPTLESIFGLESGTLAAMAALLGALAAVARLIAQPKLQAAREAEIADHKSS